MSDRDNLGYSAADQSKTYICVKLLQNDKINN